MINHYLVDLGVPLCGGYPENFLMTIYQDVRQEYLSIHSYYNIIIYVTEIKHNLPYIYMIYVIYIYNIIYIYYK